MLFISDRNPDRPQMAEEPDVSTEFVAATAIAKSITVGVYVGTLGQPKFDFAKFCALVRASHFAGFTIHCKSPWSNYDDFQDESYDPATRVYDTKAAIAGRPSTVWEAHLESCLEEAWGHRDQRPLRVSLCLNDAYFTDQWQGSGGLPRWGTSEHPYRHANNNSSINLNASALPLYDSWNRLDFTPANCAWLYWKTDHRTGHVSDFQLTHSLGALVGAYWQRVAAVCGKVRAKYPARANLWIRTYNEQYAIMLPDNSNLDYSKHLGGYNQHEFYLDALLRDQGFVPGSRYRLLDDWVAYETDHRTVYWPMTSRACKAIRADGIVHEHHGIWSLDDLNEALAAGLDPNWSNFCSDGYPDKNAGQYFSDMKNIVHHPRLVYGDVKLGGNINYNAKDMNATVADAIPKMDAAIFG